MSLVLKSVDEYLSQHSAKASKSEKNNGKKERKQQLFTVITSGKFKGKKLALPSLKTTRSTKSIVRQSFFNTVRYELSGSCFVEGFGGSALMACEAASNGASRVIAIEIDKQAFKQALKNCASLGDSAPEMVLGDSFKLLPEIVENESRAIMLYLDPPFEIRDGFNDVHERLFGLVARLCESKSLKLVCFEHATSAKMPEALGSLKLVKSKKFGATTLSYYR